MEQHAALSDTVMLAIDPAATCGWACSDGTSGVFKPGNLWTSKKHPDDRIAERAAIVSTWFADLLIDKGASVVICEKGGAPGRRSHMQIMPIVATVCGLHGVIFRTVHPSTWRAWVRQQEWGAEYVKSDENDARAMLLWGQATLRVELVA